MAPPDEPGMGLSSVKGLLSREFPALQFGYYNKTKESFNLL